MGSILVVLGEDARVEHRSVGGVGAVFPAEHPEGELGVVDHGGHHQLRPAQTCPVGPGPLHPRLPAQAPRRSRTATWLLLRFVGAEDVVVVGGGGGESGGHGGRAGERIGERGESLWRFESHEKNKTPTHQRFRGVSKSNPVSKGKISKLSLAFSIISHISPRFVVNDLSNA